ncbi:hypothetical protein [Lewinella cohaerens]|uniref:hypothetical protein n=1 Tax=Lewinella cohaerens TaxID=70995 RepID=UPI000367CD4D|nr:hypothetical protein [Lewinella cohaerens]
MAKSLLLIFSAFLFLLTPAFTQGDVKCAIAFDEVDPFDSLRTIGSEVVALGYLIPSRYELEDGPKIIEEAEAILLYSENDSISSFFFNLVLPEYKLQPIKPGMNVKLLLDDDSVIGFYNIPDEGEFDRTINMRVYQHTCPIPLDYYYKLAYHKVAQIRVEYEKQNRTLMLNDEQQEALRAAIQCVGRRIGLYPIKP